MEMLSNVLAFGYLFIVGFIFLFMLIQIFAFYIAGRATGSIDDEVTSAFTLLGAFLVIGVASTLINALISVFLEGMLIPGLLAFIAYLIAIVFAIVKIYELSVGKAILHFLLSLVIIIVLTIGTVFAATKIMPTFSVDLNSTGMMEGGLEMNSDSMETDSLDEMDTMDMDLDETTEVLMDDETTEEDMGVTVTGGPSVPALPSQPADTKESCSLSIPCSNPEALCLADVCYTEDEIRTEFVIGSENCGTVACENCHENKLDSLTLVLNENEQLNICTECDYPYASDPERPCKEGFTCLGYKCIPQ